MRLNKGKGFTLVEVLAVLLIIGIIITGMTIAISSTLTNGRVSSCTNSLQTFAADMEQILAEYGVLCIKEGDKEAQVKEYLDLIENFYVHTYFDRETLQIHDNFFEINTSTLVDGWDSVYRLQYCFSEGNAGICILASPGPDLVFEPSYAENNFGDDILLIVRPKSI